MIIKTRYPGSVGVGETKAKLSSYIDKVRRGEQVIITEHGEEVALLVPISRERRVIKSLVESGRAQWSGGKPKGLTRVAVRGKPLSETILEERQ
jgi:prevent-host-death family protein